MNEIIININEANKAQKYSDKGLFQIEAFKRVSKILNNHFYDKEKTKNIVDCRFHDTIFIDGDRGVGKTAFMLNIKNYYEKLYSEKTKKYLFLDPVDPTLLEHTEKFLSVILARIVEKVNESITNNEINSDISSKYYESLESLSKSLSAIKTLPDDIGIEEIASNKSSLKLEQHAHVFFKEVSHIFKVDGLVMLIDDIDMAFDKGFDVLEVVRKYLASPYLIPIVAGDMKLYKEIIETQFMEKIRFSDDINHLKAIYNTSELKKSSEYEDKKKLLNNLVEQYLHKIFPNEYHIQLKNIFSILKENNVKIKLSDKLEVLYEDLKDFEIRLINYGINQKKFTHQVFTDNTRDFVQYLYNKREIFIHAFNDKTIPKKEKEKDYLIISNRFDNLILEQFIKQSARHKESLKLTADFYRYSNDIDKKRLSLLLDNDVNAFTDNGYSIYNALKGDFFIKGKMPYAKIEKEIIRNSLDFPKYFTEYKAIVDNLKNKFFQEYFVFDLMLHNDYYTNTNTKHLFITGKFLEAFFCLLDSTISNKYKLISNITEPIFSDIPKNNYVKFNESYQEEEYEEDSVEIVDKFNEYFTKEQLSYNKPFISSIFLYEVLKKYIKNLNIFKIGEHNIEIEDKFNDEFNKLYKEVPYFDNMKKVLYIFLNSVAYFELQETPSNENIALGKNINNINKSRTYNKNIRKIIDNETKYKDTLSLFIYNLFKNVLNNTDKNNSLFSKTFEELNDVKKTIEKILKQYGYVNARMSDDDKEKLIDNLTENIDNLDSKIKAGILEYPRFIDNIVYFTYKKKPEVKNKANELRRLLEENINNNDTE
jgi:hypothetical protein